MDKIIKYYNDIICPYIDLQTPVGFFFRKYKADPKIHIKKQRIEYRYGNVDEQSWRTQTTRYQVLLKVIIIKSRILAQGQRTRPIKQDE